ncbi:MAG: L,D-transpeptidase family protein [Ignavibacteriaceae bacterium]|nr:L,D-transpeptidase family protein [Ignavibacteriaceae bacterium]
MSSKYQIFYLIGLIFIISSCKQDNKITLTNGTKYNIPSIDYSADLQMRFNKQDTSYSISPSDIEYFDTLKYFYKERKFEPIFIKGSDNTSLDSILNLLANSGEHGIQPQRYHVEQIKSDIAKISANNGEQKKYMANSELLLADAVLKYAYNLRYGVVNPYKLFPESYVIPAVDSAKRDIFKPFYQENVFDYLRGLQPKNPQYKKLQGALKHFSSLPIAGWEQIESPSQIDLITRRLAVLGFIDTTKINIDELSRKDSVFIKAVADFQKANGLTGDGTIGKPTLEKLNVTPDEYIQKIELSMERLRWSNYSDSTRYILVNIPEFYLHVIDNGRDRLDIKVCTGKKRPANYSERIKNYLKNKRSRPDDWQTPQLGGEISHLVLNPTWTVPPSIVKEEILRETAKDSNYLAKRNFKVFRNGKRVDLTKVDLKKYSPNKIPFSFVQDPGAGNALGKIKFMFLNKFGVYLHDTPTRGPFSRSYRAVSHGCIRVEKPFQLAEFLLANNSNWTLDDIKIETGNAVADKTKVAEYKLRRGELRKNSSYGKTTVVKFDHDIPVIIDYYTAWVDENGIVNFRNDVYDKDKILAKYLFEQEAK